MPLCLRIDFGTQKAFCHCTYYHKLSPSHNGKEMPILMMFSCWMTYPDSPHRRMITVGEMLVTTVEMPAHQTWTTCPRAKTPSSYIATTVAVSLWQWSLGISYASRSALYVDLLVHSGCSIKATHTSTLNSVFGRCRKKEKNGLGIKSMLGSTNLIFQYFQDGFPRPAAH